MTAPSTPEPAIRRARLALTCPAHAPAAGHLVICTGLDAAPEPLDPRGDERFSCARDVLFR